MAEITYGRCTNKVRCSLAINREPVFVPLDGRCPECGQPLVANMSRRRLKFLPVLLILAVLGGAGYYAWYKYIRVEPHGTSGTRMASSSAGETPDTRPDVPPPSGTEAVDSPNFDTARAENAQARSDVLERIDRMPNLTPAQKTKLTQSVDKAHGMGCVLKVPFNSGQSTIAPTESDLLASAIQKPAMQALVQDPTLVLVILGYSDKAGDSKKNLQVSIDRAESVQSTLKDRCGVQNVMYSVGMGGADFIDPKSPAKNRVVEVWAVYP